jgi:hypothetical protein
VSSLYSNLSATFEMTEATGPIYEYLSGTINATELGGTISSVTGLVNTTARDLESVNSEYFSSGPHLALQAGDIQFAVEAWCRMESAPSGDMVVVGKWSASDHEYRLFYNHGSSCWRFEVNGSGGTFGVNGSVAAWGYVYHLLAYHDSVNDYLILFVNGNIAFTGYSNGIVAGGQNFTVGRNDDGPTNYFDGVIGPVRLYKNVHFTYHNAKYLYAEGVGRQLAELNDVPGVIYIGTDTTTAGDWIGVYGADGYLFPAGTDLAASNSRPSYVKQFEVTTGGEGANANAYQWGGGSEIYRLQNPADPTGTRYGVTWFQDTGMTIFLDVGGGLHRVSLYLLDDDNNGRAQDMEVRGMAEDVSLDSARSFSSFGRPGKWVTYDITGAVRIKITTTGVANSVVAAVMFDTPAVSGPEDVPGLDCWLKGDNTKWQDAAGTVAWTTSGDPVGKIEDASGNGNHYTQSVNSDFRPHCITNQLNGYPILRFDGVDARLVGPDHLSGFVEGTVFVVVKISNDVPGSGARTGLWHMGTSAEAHHYPWTDGVIYDGWGSSTRKATVDPTPSLSSDFRIYCVVSGPGDWRSYLDGVLLYQTVTNTVAFPTAPILGAHSGGYYLDGDIAELIIYDTALSDTYREGLEQYLIDKYWGSSAGIFAQFRQMLGGINALTGGMQ